MTTDVQADSLAGRRTVVIGDRRTQPSVRKTDAWEAQPIAPQQARVPLPILVIFFAFLVPIEVSFYVGSVWITPIRLVLLIFTPCLAIALVNIRWRTPDVLIVLFVAYACVAMIVKGGQSAIPTAGIYVLENLFVYFIFRGYLKNVTQIETLLRIGVTMVVIMGILAIPEAVFKVQFLHEIPRQITGIYNPVMRDVRLGLLRASAVLEHPILYGAFCSAFLPFAWSLARSNGRAFFVTAMVLGATFLSLSSSGLLGAVLGIFLIVGERYTRHIPRRAIKFIALTAAFYLFVSVASDRGPQKLIAAYLTFNTGSAYWRILQWEFGIDDVIAHPFFGIDRGAWTRPHWLGSSVDNFYLATMMKTGVPSFLLLLGIILSVSIRLLRMPRLRRRSAKPASGAFSERRAALSGRLSLDNAFLITLIALALTGVTVHFFGTLQPIFFMLLATGAALTEVGGASMREEPPRHKGAAARATIGAPRGNP